MLPDRGARTCATRIFLIALMLDLSACSPSKTMIDSESVDSAFLVGSGGSLVSLGKVEYEGGQLKSASNYDSFREWYEDGKPKREINFLNGQIDGVYLTWHENGEKHVEVNYKNGKREGASYEWYQNGQLKEKSTYLCGVADGEYLGWHSGGQKRFTATYKKGKIEGLFSRWHADGEVRLEQNYDGGVLIVGESL